MNEYIHPFRLGGVSIADSAEDMFHLTFWDDGGGVSTVTAGQDIAEPVKPKCLPSSREVYLGRLPDEVIVSAGVNVDAMTVANPQAIIDYLRTLGR